MIAKRGGLIRNQYKQSHGTGLHDALIAATAELNDATLITFNRRHFPMLNNLQVPYER
jgi:predicted nucleic acid-binding protein